MTSTTVEPMITSGSRLKEGAKRRRIQQD